MLDDTRKLFIIEFYLFLKNLFVFFSFDFVNSVYSFLKPFCGFVSFSLKFIWLSDFSRFFLIGNFYEYDFGNFPESLGRISFSTSPYSLMSFP